jgi:hypothetical protein
MPSSLVDPSATNVPGARLPTYRTPTSQYCLLAFGPEASTRMWLIRDDDTVILDQSGPVTTYSLPPAADANGWRECLLSDICETDGTIHRDLRFIQTRDQVVLTLHSDAYGLRNIAWLVDEIQLASAPDQPPLVHFHGPLVVVPAIVVRGATTTLFAHVGSKGSGKGTFASITPSIAAQVLARPVANVEFVGYGGPRRQERMELAFDC